MDDLSTMTGKTVYSTTPTSLSFGPDDHASNHHSPNVPTPTPPYADERTRGSLPSNVRPETDSWTPTLGKWDVPSLTHQDLKSRRRLSVGTLVRNSLFGKIETSDRSVPPHHTHPPTVVPPSFV